MLTCRLPGCALKGPGDGRESLHPTPAYPFSATLQSQTLWKGASPGTAATPCQSAPHLCQVITEPPCGATGLGRDRLFTPALKENPEAGPAGCERDRSSTEDAFTAFRLSARGWCVLQLRPAPPCRGSFLSPCSVLPAHPFWADSCLLL